jgi:tRNA pseudouridine55 synthase
LFQCLISLDKPLETLPSVHLSEEQAISVRFGQTILVSHTDSSSSACQGSIRMYRDEVFLGLGEILLDGKIAPKKLFHLNN